MSDRFVIAVESGKLDDERLTIKRFLFPDHPQRRTFEVPFLKAVCHLPVMLLDNGIQCDQCYSIAVIET